MLPLTCSQLIAPSLLPPGGAIPRPADKGNGTGVQHAYARMQILPGAE